MTHARLLIALLRRIALALAALALLVAGEASATIDSVAGSPAPLRVNVIAPQTLSVTWRVQVTTTIPVTISSAAGQVFVDGSPVATLNGAVSRGVTTVGTSFVTIRETLRISRALARRIGAGGVIDYRRGFVQTPPGAPVVAGMVAIQPTGSGQLSVANLELRFDDNSQYRIVAQGDRLVARAELTSTGAGAIEGVWEHAGPGSISAGSAAFVPLRRDRRALAGSRRTVLLSPPLPTAIAGVHVVRFRPLRLEGAGAERLAAVELRYVVTPGDPAVGIALLAPDETALLGPATQFVWRPEPGAATQRLEFLAPGAGPVDGTAERLAAVDLPGGVGATRLKPFTLGRLARHRGPIFWRIVAFDGAGNAIARSELRTLAREGR